MSEKQKRKHSSEITNEELEKKNLNKFKILDGMTAYTFSLVLFACAYGFLTDIIGVWALYAACAFSLVSLFILIKLTGLKFRSTFKFSPPKKTETIGCALVLASAFMLSMPTILFSHIIAPNLAVTSFNIYAIVDQKGGIFIVIMLVLLIAICENLLFDGYIYSRFKGVKNLAFRVTALSLMAAVLRLDFYALPTVFIMSFAALLVRIATDSMTLALVIRLFSSSFVMAMTNVSATSSELLGKSMGAVQVSGMTMIFVGIALPAIAGSLGAFGKLGEKGKIVGFASGVLAIVFVAAGCGVSAL